MSLLQRYIGLVFILIFSISLGAQDTIQLDSAKLLKPYKGAEIGLSAHLNYFQGDIAHSSLPTNDLVNNLSYSLFFRKPVSKWVGIDYQFSIGKITVGDGPEAFPNVNFQSNILAHQLGVSISLRQLIYKDKYNPLIYPVLHLGAELMTFRSFTDIRNEADVRYNYWSDGTIRNLPESVENSDASVLLQRDYEYETDLRMMDNELRGGYSQITYGFPLSVSLKARLHKQLHLTAYGTYHLIQTNLIDDVTERGTGTRQGNADMDDYLSFGARLSYDFGAISKKDNEIKLKKKLAKKRRRAAKRALQDAKYARDEEERKKKEEAERQKKLAKEAEEEQKKNDKKAEKERLKQEKEAPDLSQEDEVKTEQDVSSSNEGAGEPKSDEDDVVINYEDDDNATVRETPDYSSSNTSSDNLNELNTGDYMVLIESYKGGVPVDEMNQLLMIKGIKTRKEGGMLNFETGGYDKSSAESVLAQVKSKGFANAYIYTGSPSSSISNQGEMLGSSFDASSSTYIKPSVNKVDMTGLVFKVQVGAFKNTIDESRFSSISNLSKESTSTGVVRYFGGEYMDYKEALDRSSQLDSKGFKGAFVVPYRNGKRISLTELDLGPSRRVSKPSNSGVSFSSDLIYRVQLGVFEKDVPFELLSVYLKVSGLDQNVDNQGRTTYYAGSFATYNQASQAKKEVLNLGIKGAFLVAFYKGKSISVSEALKLE